LFCAVYQFVASVLSTIMYRILMQAADFSVVSGSCSVLTFIQCVT